MKKRDPVIIATASVLVVAFTISLLNIYVFPNLFFSVDIYRNTENEIQLGILHEAENIGLNTSLWDGLNRTRIILDSPELSLVNITLMIQNSINQRSGAYDSYSLRPGRISLDYNGTILGASNETAVYIDWIESKFGETYAGTYFTYLNSSLEYVSHSNQEDSELSAIVRADIEGNLTGILGDSSREPIFAIYQSISYYESRGLLSSYSTSFSRLILMNEFGDVIFFLSNEGSWNIPLFA
ncbi:MAG: hypothetical protein KGD64_15030 [Candidatus Heimdallarchaeota archaeon]|nr:hypothetical protein [Candidatus Heimdallarchaeota archaeon]